MSSTSTRYQARFEIPELVERGRPELVLCPVYRSGQLVPPTASGSSVSIFDGAGAVVVNAAPVTVTNGIAQYTIAANLTSGRAYGRGWRFEWSLAMPDGVVHLFRNDGALVKYRLYPVISDIDVVRRIRSLDPTSASVITARTTFGDAIDEADVELQLRLLANDRRPNLVATPTALRMTWLMLTIAIVFEGLAGSNPVYTDAAKTWRGRYEDAYDDAAAAFTYDDTETPGAEVERSGLRAPGFWTC